jgi:hypothetical protein
MSLTAVVCVSCDKGEDFTYTTYEIEKEYTFTISLFGTEEISRIEQLPLSEIIGEEAAKKLIYAEVYPDSFFIAIEGLNALDPKPVLSNVIVSLKDPIALNNYPGQQPTIADREIFNLGNFTSDKKMSSGVVTYFFETLFYFYNHSIREPAFIISAQSTSDFSASNNVKLHIMFKGKYGYIVIN